MELEGKLQERYLHSQWHWGWMVEGSRWVIKLVHWVDAGLDFPTCSGESALLGLAIGRLGRGREQVKENIAIIWKSLSECASCLAVG